MPLGIAISLPTYFFQLDEGGGTPQNRPQQNTVRVAAGEADDQEAPQLRGGTFAEIHGCHRRFARMRSSTLFCESASAERRRHRAHVARDRDPRPQSAVQQSGIEYLPIDIPRQRRV